MNAERFADLAMAYGGDIRRWPAEHQTSAYAWLRDDESARGVLLEAGVLDAALNADAPTVASGMLRESILARAPRSKPLWSRAGTWVSGAGLAAACAAGVFVGGVNSSSLLPNSTAGVAVTASAAPAAAATPVVVRAAGSASTAPEAAVTPAADATTDSTGVYFGDAWFSGLETQG